MLRYLLVRIFYSCVAASNLHQSFANQVVSKIEESNVKKTPISNLVGNLFLTLAIGSSISSIAFGAEKKKSVIAEQTKTSVPFEIKKTRLGMSFAEFSSLYPIVAGRCKDDGGMKTCDFYAHADADQCQLERRMLGYCKPPRVPELETVADCRVMTWYFFFLEGKLGHEEIQLESKCYSSISLGFLQKFGKPNKTENSKIKTKGGGEFNQVEQVWLSNEETMTLEKYGTSINDTYVTLSGSEYRKMKSKEIEKKAGDI